MYATYASVMASTGAKMVRVPLLAADNFRIQAADIEKKITAGTSLIFLNTPHNPTGAVLTEQDITDIGAVAKKHDLWLLPMQKKTMGNRQGHNRISVGKALVQYLENRGISVVFGIPGVHTLALYRGLEQAAIRHVTPRHEQGAGFMADGYARASGKPGAAFVITGPGVTNILTATGQALADSIPMLVVSSVNAADSLGKGLGHLHELPDQQGICKKLFLRSEHIHTARDILPLLIQGLAPVAETGTWGEHTAKTVCSKARAELPPGYGHMVEMVETIRDTMPGSIIVGDSTQPVYAANLYYGHDNPRGWFNAATGFGTLGYAIPAAIGACLADPGRPVVCITGDGGAQFTLPEMMTARDESLPVVFLIWNNFGFKEIADAMADADITPIGCCQRPPDFQDIARAYGMPYVKCHNTVSDLAGTLKSGTLKSHADSQQPVVIEIQIPYRDS